MVCDPMYPQPPVTTIFAIGLVTRQNSVILALFARKD
jgi:hypothetical protein